MTDPINTLLQRSLLTLGGTKAAADKSVGKAEAATETVTTQQASPAKPQSVELDVRFISEKAGKLENILANLETSVLTIRDGMERLSRVSDLLEVAGGTAVRARDVINGTAQTENPEAKLADLNKLFLETLQNIDTLANANPYGKNLLAGETVVTQFDVEGRATMETAGIILNTTELGIEAAPFESAEQADALRALVVSVTDELKLFKQQLTADINTIQTKQDFSLNAMQILSEKAVGNVLPSGAEEAANLLALQLRQQLSGSDFGLASDQQRTLLRQF